MGIKKTPEQLADRIIEEWPIEGFSQMVIPLSVVRSWTGERCGESFIGVANASLADWSEEDGSPLVSISYLNGTTEDQDAILITSTSTLLLSTLGMGDAEVFSVEDDEDPSVYSIVTSNLEALVKLVKNEDGFDYKVITFGIFSDEDDGAEEPCEDEVVEAANDDGSLQELVA